MEWIVCCHGNRFVRSPFIWPQTFLLLLLWLCLQDSQKPMLLICIFLMVLVATKTWYIIALLLKNIHYLNVLIWETVYLDVSGLSVGNVLSHLMSLFAWMHMGMFLSGCADSLSLSRLDGPWLKLHLGSGARSCTGCLFWLEWMAWMLGSCSKISVW